MQAEAEEEEEEETPAAVEAYDPEDWPAPAASPKEAEEDAAAPEEAEAAASPKEAEEEGDDDYESLGEAKSPDNDAFEEAAGRAWAKRQRQDKEDDAAGEDLDEVCW